jgi:hypothetical protein
MTYLCLSGPFARLRLCVAIFAALLAGGAGGWTLVAGPAVTDDEVEALAAYARLYGYVRWFHPSDEGAEVDWERLAVLGAADVRRAREAGGLQTALGNVFQPIAPTLALRPIGSGGVGWPHNLPELGGRVTYWQHRGVKLGSRPSPYLGRRVISDDTSKERKPLFEGSPMAAPILAVTLNRDLEARLPLVLPVDQANRTAGALAPSFLALKERLAACEYVKGDPNDPAVRVAGVVILWNVMQHFFPYHAEAGVDWMAQLRPALRAALVAETPDDFRDGLCRLVARLQDGHGVYYAELSEQRAPVHEHAQTAGGLSIRVAMVDERIVVTAVREAATFVSGDVIESVGGVSACKVLAAREELVSGSPHLRRYRALNRFGQGPVGATIDVNVERDGARMTIPVTLEADQRGYFFNPMPEFELPTFAEVAPGIFYVNLVTCTKADYVARLDDLAQARGVIFDWRWDGQRRPISGPPVSVVADVIPYLTNAEVHSAPFLVPQIVRPDREGWTWWDGGWPLKPKPPRFAGKVAFITTPGVVSYGETCMAIIDHYQLAMIVGEPTAGCNGNANFLSLPGGGTLMWTGMRVTRHDGSQLYLRGYQPDHPVARTIEAIKAGRDEMVERAITAIQTATAER